MSVCFGGCSVTRSMILSYSLTLVDPTFLPYVFLAPLLFSKGYKDPLSVIDLPAVIGMAEITTGVCFVSK